MSVSEELDNRFREAAAAAGLIDAAFDLADTPIGTLLVAATDRGLCQISFDTDRGLDELSRHFGTRVLRVPRKLDVTRRELDEYFEGRRTEFGMPLAAKVGHPRAARAVGVVMNRNPIPIVLPCHRVIGANGSLTGYGGGLHVKQALLELEGAILA